MALSKGAKVALALVGTATVVGGVVYVANQSKPKPKKNKKPKPDADVGIDDGEEPTEPTPRPPMKVDGLVEELPAVLEEPLGGWEHRWAQRKAEAIPACRAKVGASLVGSQGAWTAYWRCIAVEAFPETAGRLEPSEWPKWLKNDAAIQIRQDVKQYLDSQGVSTQGMKFLLWLRFDSLIDGCWEALAPHEDAVAHCVASEIYPKEDWPPESDASPWQVEFWEMLNEKVSDYVDNQGGGPTRLGFTPT